MGREEKRKQERKRKENKSKIKNLEKELAEEDNDMKRLIKIFIGVIACLAVFYLIFAFFHGELFKKSEKEKETIQNVEIMAGNLLNRDESEYYVLLYKFDGDNEKLCSGIYNVYTSKESTTKMYKVNLSSGLNKDYMTDKEAEINTSSIEGLKVIDATLLKVKDGKVVETISGRDKLVAYEDTLLK
jgi:hypothetical protein